MARNGPIGAGHTIMIEQNPRSRTKAEQRDADAGAPAAAEADEVRPIGSRPAQRSGDRFHKRPGEQTTHDAEVRLVADGVTLRPVHARGETYCFVVQASVQSVSLESRFSIQADIAPADADNSRRLGVRVTTITIRSHADEIVIPVDDPRLTRGWYAAERKGITIWRWTDGAAQIPWIDISGPAVVTIRCSTLTEYPTYDEIPEPGRLALGTDGLTERREGDAGRPGFWAGVTPNLAPMDPSKVVRMQWCLGMYSSGSTWVFNAIRSVGNALFPGEPHIGVYAESVDQLPPGWSQSDRFIVKSHHPDEVATALLRQHADRIWISIRDPRDSVASALTYMYPDFASALTAVTRSALHCERFVGDPRCVLLRYEDAYIDDPATFDRFAAALSRTLSPEDRGRLFRQTRRTAIEAMIQQLDPNETVDDGFPGHRVHMETQWHTHHVNRTGEVGRWRRTLDAAQAMEVQRRLRSWMARFGYNS